MTAYLVEISAKNDLKCLSQQPDAKLMVSYLLERLRGAARATQPRTQKALFDIGAAISLSLSSNLLNEEKTEKYKDLRALLQLLTNLCSKDLVDFSSDSDEVEKTDIGQVVYLGLHIVTPLISLDLLKYPKLCRDYFALLSHILEVYPEKVAQLNVEAFTHTTGTLDFGLHHQACYIPPPLPFLTVSILDYTFKTLPA
ncbi:hypothetical protein ACLOJK_009658 [Asimina triloba]